MVAEDAWAATVYDKSTLLEVTVVVKSDKRNDKVKAAVKPEKTTKRRHLGNTADEDLAAALRFLEDDDDDDEIDFKGPFGRPAKYAYAADRSDESLV